MTKCDTQHTIRNLSTLGFGAIASFFFELGWVDFEFDCSFLTQVVLDQRKMAGLAFFVGGQDGRMSLIEVIPTKAPSMDAPHEDGNFKTSVRI